MQQLAAWACLLLALPMPAGAAEVDKFERFVGHECTARDTSNPLVDPGTGTDWKTVGFPKATGKLFVWPTKFTTDKMTTEEQCAKACADPEMPFVCTAYQYTKYRSANDGKHCKFTRNPLNALENKPLPNFKDDVCGFFREFPPAGLCPTHPQFPPGGSPRAPPVPPHC